MLRLFRPVSATFHIFLTLFLLMLASAPALAQLEDIVVTARKVEESLADVPLSITAFSAKEIQRTGMQNLEDVAAFTPGLSFFNPIGEFLPTPVIRGIAPTDIFGENNAAVFIDGVFVAGREGLNFNFLDVERIEVVKGPQSALYGRNAFAGALNYVTKRPTDEFESRVEVLGGNDSRLRARAFVSGPLIGDTLRGRASLGYDTFGGSYDNPLGGQDVGGYEYKSLSAGLEWTPTDSLNFLLQGFLSDDAVDIGPTTSISMNCEDIAPPGSASTRRAAYCGEIPDLAEQNQLLGIPGDETIQKVAGATGEERDLVRISLNVDWDLDFGTVTFLTGYTNTKQTGIDDGARNLGNDQPFEYCTVAAGPFCAGPTSFFSGLVQPNAEEETEEISQEIRFTSPGDRPLRYSLGAYIYDVDGFAGQGGGLISTRPLPDDFVGFGPFVTISPGTFVPIGTGAFSPWFQPGGDVNTPNFDEFSNGTSGWAGFGWTELDFLEDFTARVELRYTNEKKEVGIVTQRQDPDTGEITRTPSGRDDDWQYWTGRLSLQYRVSDTWQAYGSIANGTKSGLLETLTGDAIPDINDPGTTVPVATILPVAEENLIAYELGVKGSALDERLRLDMAIFFNDWTDIVVRTTFLEDPATGFLLDTPQGARFNGGDAEVWGFDIGGAFAVTDNFTTSFGLGYQDAKWVDAKLFNFNFFSDYGGEQCRDPATAPDSCGQVAGNQVARQPKWQGNISGTYQRQLVGDWEWFARADLTYQDKYFPQDENLSTIPARTLLNLRLGFESGRYSIEFWGRNVLNDDSAIASFRDVYFGNTDDVTGQSAPSDPQQFFPFRFTVNNPVLRTWGVTATVRFGGDARL